MSRNTWLPWIAAGFALSTCGLAQAETLISQTGLISGRQAFTFELDVDGAGTISVLLADLNWQGRLANLSFSLSQTQLLEPVAVKPLAAGSTPVQMYEVASAGTYYAHVSGEATGLYGIGLYALHADFEALEAAVPLPAAGWLLLSGAGALWGLRRRAATGV